jgi:hypothetical protein
MGGRGLWLSRRAARPPAVLISRLSHGAWVATWKGSGGAWHKVPCRRCPPLGLLGLLGLLAGSLTLTLALVLCELLTAAVAPLSPGRRLPPSAAAFWNHVRLTPRDGMGPARGRDDMASSGV